jgi:hypothetical protein
MNDVEQEEVLLPSRIMERVDDRVAYTDFDSSEAYISYVLEEVLYRVEKHRPEDDEPVDEADVKNRLKSLGYLDE